MWVVVVIILQIVIFAFLAIFLKKMLTQNVTSATSHLEQMTQEYMNKQEEVKKKLEETKHLCQKEVASAREEAQKLKIEMLKQINEEKEKIIAEAHTESEKLIKQGEKARENLIVDIEKKIRLKSIETAAELVGDVLSENTRKFIHESLTKDFIKEGLRQLDEIPASEDAVSATVRSAFSLSEEELAVIENRLKAKNPYLSGLEKKVDPAIIAGLIITIGSVVIDASFVWKIKERTRELIRQQ